MVKHAVIVSAGKTANCCCLHGATTHPFALCMDGKHTSKAPELPKRCVSGMDPGSKSWWIYSQFPESILAIGVCILIQHGGLLRSSIHVVNANHCRVLGYHAVLSAISCLYIALFVGLMIDSVCACCPLRGVLAFCKKQAINFEFCLPTTARWTTTAHGCTNPL